MFSPYVTDDLQVGSEIILTYILLYLIYIYLLVSCGLS